MIDVAYEDAPCAGLRIGAKRSHRLRMAFEAKIIISFDQHLGVD